MNVRRRIAACRATATRVTRALGYTDDQIRDLIGAALLTRNAWLEWGPTDDGSPSGDAFDLALTELHKKLGSIGLHYNPRPSGRRYKSDDA